MYLCQQSFTQMMRVHNYVNQKLNWFKKYWLKEIKMTALVISLNCLLDDYAAY